MPTDNTDAEREPGAGFLDAADALRDHGCDGLADLAEDLGTAIRDADREVRDDG